MNKFLLDNRTSHGLSSDRDQIPHSEKLIELPNVYKRIVGNRKAGKTLTFKLVLLHYLVRCGTEKYEP